MSKLSIPKKKWLNILEDFAEQVAAKKFTKVKYETWRQMVRPIKSDYIELYQHNHIIEIGYEGTKAVWDSIVADTQVISYEFGFTLCDNSFGDYLFENWEKIENSLYITLDSLDDATGIATKPSITGGVDYNKLCADSTKAIEGTKINGCDLDTASSNSNYGVLNISAKDIYHNGVSIVDALTTKVDKSDTINTVKEVVKRIFDENKNDNEENKNMKNFNFDFGKVMDSQARVSMYGIAVKSPSGTWVAYDKKAEQMMDVDILNFEGMDMLYKMPVALNQVAAGDVIIHMGKPCFVVSFNEEGKSFNVIDIFNAEEKCILPPRSPFGFSFVTKIVSLIGDFSGSATEDSPFGNLWMYMMMKDDNDKKNLLPMMLMMRQNAETHNIMNNPLALMMLMKNNDNKDNDILPYFMMASMWPPEGKNN